MPDDVRLDQPALENSAKEIQDLCKGETFSLLKKSFRDSGSAAFRGKVLLILERLNLPEGKEFLQGARRAERDKEEKGAVRNPLDDEPAKQAGSKMDGIAEIVNRMPDDVALDQPVLENSTKEIQKLCKEETLDLLEKAFKASDAAPFRRKALLVLLKLNLPKSKEFFVGVLRGGRDDQEKELALGFLRDKPTEDVVREIALTTIRSGGGHLKSKAHRALAAMAETNREGVVKILLDMACVSGPGEANAFLRKAAFDVLRRMPGKGVTEFFRGKLNSTDDEARLTAVKTLGRWRDAESFPRIAEMVVSDTAPEIRCEAATTLGALRDESYIPQLIAALSDSDPKVRQAAVHALQKMTGQSFRDEHGVWALWWKQQKQRREQLLDMLDSDSDDAILQAITLLGKERLGRKQIATRIEPLVDSNSKRVCHVALRALGDLGQESSIRVLLDMLGTNDSAALVEALKALGKMTAQREKIAAQIGSLATDYDDMVAATACRVLGDLRCPASVPVLVHAANNLQGKPLLVAIRALGRVGAGNPKAVDTLIQLAGESNDAVAGEACSALGETRSKQAIPVLISMLGGGHRVVSIVAYRALTQITGKRLPPNQDAWSTWWKAAESR
ncbi:MAG: HEAT repeat domain-containing protein [Planctomycetes bacterium]|nr:HEAT repeat domain-containing protein [Planctomycetota bacterium]